VLIQLGDWGWDDVLTGALGGLTDEFFLEGSLDARAVLEPSLCSGLVQHEGESSQTWPKDAHMRGLSIFFLLNLFVKILHKNS